MTDSHRDDIEMKEKVSCLLRLHMIQSVAYSRSIDDALSGKKKKKKMKKTEEKMKRKGPGCRGIISIDNSSRHA
jgi:hypothetical protein